VYSGDELADGKLRERLAGCLVRRLDAGSLQNSFNLRRFLDDIVRWKILVNPWQTQQRSRKPHQKSVRNPESGLSPIS
jgi:hypothetical protein